MRRPSLIQALTPVLVLIILLFMSVRLFGDGRSEEHTSELQSQPWK